MLNINDRRPLSLALWAQCFVDQDSSLYIGCDGSEVPFRSSLFTIQKTNEDIPFVIKVIKIVIIMIKCKMIFKYPGRGKYFLRGGVGHTVSK